MKLHKYHKNPILLPNSQNSWESLVVCNPAAWYENGTFYLLYRAAGDDEHHLIYLGLAISDDGFNFRRISDQPVLAPDIDGYDSGCEDPRLVKMGGLYYVTYAYRSYPPGRYWAADKKNYVNVPNDGIVPTALYYNISQTALAISPDLKTFKKLGRITTFDYDNRDVILFPEKINGKFVRLERPVIKPGIPAAIWINYSDNLMDWEVPRLLIAPEKAWEMKKIGGSTPPLRTEAGWLVLYHGVALYDDQYRVGALLLDAADPEIVIARTKDYLMEPEFPYETAGFYNGCVFPTGNVIVDDTLFVYYGGADRFCCVATCSVNELLKYLLSEGKR
ncbi:MAG: hypothetical protein WC958_06430 [Dehalococcoidales bacterium]